MKTLSIRRMCAVLLLAFFAAPLAAGEEGDPERIPIAVLPLGLERRFGPSDQDDDAPRLAREFEQGEGFARLAYARNVLISLLFFGAVYWGYRRLR